MSRRNCFAKSGYEATTTAAIAQAADITEPILYRHFKSKQELFVAIVRDVSRRTLEQWEKLIADEIEPTEKIRLIAAAMPDHIKRLSEYYHVLHGALATSRDKKVLAVMREHYEQIEEFFSRIVIEGQKSGAFEKNVAAKSVAWQLIFAGIGYAMITLNLGPADRELTHEVIDSIVRGIKR